MNLIKRFLAWAASKLMDLIQAYYWRDVTREDVERGFTAEDRRRALDELKRLIS